MHQPDFQAIFFETFENVTGPVTYRIRKDSNFEHDLKFLGSLIHDAEFKPSDIKREKRSVRISIVRLRWERRAESARHKISKVRSSLIFKNVKEIQWQPKSVWLFAENAVDVPFRSDPAAVGDPTMEISKIINFQEERPGDLNMLDIGLTGYPGRWLLRLKLAPERWSIYLEDDLLPMRKV